MNKEKQQYVVRAGTNVFFRLGYKRTTMADIAKEAGVSRPALYQLFENKDAIFKASVKNYGLEILKRIQHDLEADKDPKHQLTVAFEHFTVTSLEVAQKYPYAEDVTTGHLDLAKKELAKIVVEFNHLLANILKQAAAPQTPEDHCQQLAVMMSASCNGFRQSASDVVELRALLNTLIDTILTSITTPQTT